MEYCLSGMETVQGSVSSVEQVFFEVRTGDKVGWKKEKERERGGGEERGREGELSVRTVIMAQVHVLL